MDACINTSILKIFLLIRQSDTVTVYCVQIVKALKFLCENFCRSCKLCKVFSLKLYSTMFKLAVPCVIVDTQYTQMCVCAHVHTHTHVHTHAHTYTHGHIRTDTYAGTHTYARTHTHTHARMHTYISCMPCTLTCRQTD